MICQNSSNSGNYPYYPQCFKGIVEYKIDIFYSDLDTDMDSLLLCKECLNHIKKSARKHGYKIGFYKVANS